MKVESLNTSFNRSKYDLVLSTCPSEVNTLSIRSFVASANFESLTTRFNTLAAESFESPNEETRFLTGSKLSKFVFTKLASLRSIVEACFTRSFRVSFCDLKNFEVTNFLNKL